jgi:hypothetical protein
MSGRRTVWAAAVFLAAAGCAPAGVKLVPVRGKVTLTDGTAVSHGYVVFHPDPAKGNASKEICQGQIKNGEYVILTGPKEGAPPGWYKVTVEAAKVVDPNNPYFTEWLADQRYVDAEKSGLTAEVVESPEPGRYDFKLDPHPKQKEKKGK